MPTSRNTPTRLCILRCVSRESALISVSKPAHDRVKKAKADPSLPTGGQARSMPYPCPINAILLVSSREEGERRDGSLDTSKGARASQCMRTQKVQSQCGKGARTRHGRSTHATLKPWHLWFRQPYVRDGDAT